MTRNSIALLSVLMLAAPGAAVAQARSGGVSLQASAGTHVNAGGHTESVSVGFSPNAHLTFLIGAERLHIPTERSAYGATRGGTTTFASGEVRFLPARFDGASPYILAGIGRGVSRPTVNETFPTPVTNDAQLLFFGGGVQTDINDHLSAFVDARFGFQSELDSVALLVPVRGGLGWRF